MGTLLQSNLTRLYQSIKITTLSMSLKVKFYLSLQHCSSPAIRFLDVYSPFSLQGLWLLVLAVLWSLSFLLPPVPAFPLCPWLVKCSYQVFKVQIRQNTLYPNFSFCLYSLYYFSGLCLFSFCNSSGPFVNIYWHVCLLFKIMWSLLYPHFRAILNTNYVPNKRNWMNEWRIHSFFCVLYKFKE